MSKCQNITDNVSRPQLLATFRPDGRLNTPMIYFAMTEAVKKLTARDIDFGTFKPGFH